MCSLLMRVQLELFYFRIVSSLNTCLSIHDLQTTLNPKISPYLSSSSVGVSQHIIKYYKTCDIKQQTFLSSGVLA